GAGETLNNQYPEFEVSTEGVRSAADRAVSKLRQSYKAREAVRELTIHSAPFHEQWFARRSYEIAKLETDSTVIAHLLDEVAPLAHQPSWYGVIEQQAQQQEEQTQ